MAPPILTPDGRRTVAWGPTAEKPDRHESYEPARSFCGKTPSALAAPPRHDGAPLIPAGTCGGPPRNNSWMRSGEVPKLRHD